MFDARTKLSYCKVFHRKLITNRNEKTEILELSKILMYEFWYYYVKPKYDEKAKLCEMDTDSFIAYLKTDDTSKYIAEDIETRFNTLNSELDRPLLKGKHKKSNWINER